MKSKNEEVKFDIHDIKKNEIYRVPDGYFENLPQVIQSRVIQPDRKNSWVPILKYAIPAMMIILLVVVGIQSGEKQLETEELISEFSTEEVIDYLNDTDLSSSEIVLAAVSSDEIESFLDAPDYAEEYLYDESILLEIEWLEDETNVVDI